MAKKKTKVVRDDEDTADEPVAVNDAWTGMLVISFLALSLGTGFVAYEYFIRYGAQDFPGPVPKFSAPPTPKQLDAAPKPPDPAPKPPDPAPKADDMKDDEKKALLVLPWQLALDAAPVNRSHVCSVPSRNDRKS